MTDTNKNAAKLADADLEKVAGGFYEQDNYVGSFGMRIECPSCRESNPLRFTITSNDLAAKVTTYKCLSCERSFTVNGVTGQTTLEPALNGTRTGR